MSDNGNKTLIIGMLAIVLVIVLANQYGTQIIYGGAKTGTGWETNTTSEYNIGEPTPFITAIREQYNPESDGDWMVWQDYRNGNWDIYAYNFVDKQEVVLANTIAHEMYPHISGDSVVWAVRSGSVWSLGGMFLNNLTAWTKNTFTGVEIYDLDISGMTVIYNEAGTYNGYYHVYEIHIDTLTRYDVEGLTQVDSLFFMNQNITLTVAGYGGGEYYYKHIGLKSTWGVNIVVGNVMRSRYMANANYRGDTVYFHRILYTFPVSIRLRTSNGITNTLDTISFTDTSLPTYLRIAITDGWVFFNSYADGKWSIVGYHMENTELVQITEPSDTLEYGRYGITATEDAVFFTVKDGATTDIWAVSLVGGVVGEEDDDNGNGVAPPPPEKEGLFGLTGVTLYAVIALVVGGVIFAVELGVYKGKHLKSIAERVNLGLIVSVGVIILIILFWIFG